MKFQGILLCSDFDGTLRVTPENIRALEYFIANGGCFTMASGRYPTHFRDAVKGLPLTAPVVALNGNVIYDLNTDEILWSNPMPDSLAEEVVRFTAENYDDFEMHINYVNGGITFTPKDGDTLEATLRAMREDKPSGSPLKFHIIHRPKIPAEMRAAYETLFPQFTVTTSSWAGLELYLPAGGKGNAIRELRRMLLPDIHTVVGVGDWENDLCMIKYADIGYAVANACDEMKAAADRVTVDHLDNAIAKIIEDLDKEF